MLYPRMRGVVMSCGVAAMLLATPAQSNACAFLNSLFGCGGAARTTYMAPYVPQAYAPAYAPSCAPCATQTCRYVPQTCYRTVYRRVPVTTYRAVSSCDPCTGYPVTYYRPVTAWTSQAYSIPYRTYRLSYSTPYVSAVSYGSCAPYTPCNPCVGSSIGSGCSSCVGGTVTQEARPYSESIPSPAPETTPPPKTFQEQPKPSTETLKPTPDSNTKSLPGPKLLDLDNRTTLRPVRPSGNFRLISSPSKSPIDDGGWRAASD